MWDLPLAVKIDGVEHKIRNQCDYRVVLDVIAALNDEELEMHNRIACALFIFYEDFSDLKDMQVAANEMMKIINLGEEPKAEDNKPRLMDWEHDFSHLAPPISRVLGYSVRSAANYTHWYDFIGAYMEIGECTFSQIVSIRNKKIKGKKLENWEREFYTENRTLVDLPQKLTAEEEEFLNSEW
jgi:hypothetical protein